MKRLRYKPTNEKSQGLGIVEAMVVTVLLLSLGGSLVSAMSSLKHFTSTSTARQKLQQQAESALLYIMKDLKRSGAVTVAGNAYPYLFVNGNATGAFSAHAHPAATHTAASTDSDYGSNREMVFVLPADSSPANGIPDTDSAGNLVWGTTQYSYVLITDSNGINRLQRRTDAVSPGVMVASHVERVTFDMNSSDFTLPLYCVRVRVYLRMKDDDGTICKYQTEATVRLGNT